MDWVDPERPVHSNLGGECDRRLMGRTTTFANDKNRLKLFVALSGVRKIRGA
jgi:hypothetical protein